jgi:hypothetical protein
MNLLSGLTTDQLKQVLEAAAGYYGDRPTTVAGWIGKDTAALQVLLSVLGRLPASGERDALFATPFTYQDKLTTLGG